MYSEQSPVLCTYSMGSGTAWTSDPVYIFTKHTVTLREFPHQVRSERLFQNRFLPWFRHTVYEDRLNEVVSARLQTNSGEFRLW